MSQTDTIQSVADIGGLVHEKFINGVYPWLEFMGPLLALFQTAGPGEFTMNGEKIVFAGDVTYSGGAMGTGGWLPDHQYIDPVNFETTPVRIYVRRAIDSFVEARATGDGAFDDLLGRITEQMFDAFERTQNRHIHGSSSGYVALTSSRTSATEIVLKDGLGHPNQNPVSFLEPGMDLGWLDASNSFAVGGAAKILSIDYSTNTVVFATDFDDGGTTVAADDPVVFVTTPETTARYFDTEYGKAPLGLLDLIDPLENNSTYLGVSEATYPRVKPIRSASASFDEVEIMEHWEEIRSKSTSEVSAMTHTNTMHPGSYIELAKSLLPYTQIQEKGKELDGGWTAVRIAGQDFLQDPWHIFDVMYTLCMEDMRVVDLNGDPNIYTDDGNQYSRLADFDGREWFARYYVQRLLKRRNRCGALTGVPNPSATRYDPTPNY